MRDQPPHLGQAAITYGPPVPEFIPSALLFAVVLTVIAGLICALQLRRQARQSKRGRLGDNR